MGIFNKSKLDIKREQDNNKTRIFVDYHKQKNPLEFKAELIRELIGKNLCLVVIDTRLAYMTPGTRIEDDIKEFNELLIKHMFSYRKIVVQSEAKANILGIPIKVNGSKKVNNYIIGFVISPEDMAKVEKNLDKFNVNYYIIMNEEDTEELLDKFYNTRGEMEELTAMFEYNLYNDTLFHKMRICPNNENNQYVEQTLQKYL